MIGSAFAVVLPEGFEVLYSAAEDSHAHSRRLRSAEAMDSETEMMPGESQFGSQQRVLLEGHDHGHRQGSTWPSWAPGAALLAGFLVMMLFEYLHHNFGSIPKGTGHVRSLLTLSLLRIQRRANERVFRVASCMFCCHLHQSQARIDHSHGQAAAWPCWAPEATLLAGFLAVMLIDYLHHDFGSVPKGSGHMRC
jgi:hypothetical protein